MSKKLMAGAVAGLLLLSASSGIAARVVDTWLVAGFTSTSGTDYIEGTDLCIRAFGILINQNGFVYKGAAAIEPRLIAHFFTRDETPDNAILADNAILVCLANIVEGEPGVPGLEPGVPGE